MMRSEHRATENIIEVHTISLFCTLLVQRDGLVGQDQPQSTEGGCGRACLESYDPPLLPEAPIGLTKKDSTNQKTGQRLPSRKLVSRDKKDSSINPGTDAVAITSKCRVSRWMAAGYDNSVRGFVGKVQVV